MSRSPDEKTVFSQGSLIDRMSSNPSSRSHSTPLLFVVLDCLYYLAGEKVNGEILLNLPSDYPAGCLKLISKGLEKLSSSSQSPTVNLIYNLETAVKTWSSKTPEGQYVFPFSFKLPHYVPSTFYFSGFDESSNSVIAGEVSYEVICALEFVDNEEKNLTHNRFINVRNKDTRKTSSPSWLSIEPIVGICCNNKGSTFFKIIIRRDDHPLTDSEINFQLEIDNTKCRAAILNVQSQIKLEVEFVMNEKNSRFVKVFSQCSKDLWLTSHSNMVNAKDFEFDAVLEFDEKCNPASNNTALIKCNYFIEIFVSYNTRLKAPVVLQMPLHVNPKHNFSKENPNIPENWSPGESPVYSAFVEESLSNNMSSEVLNFFIN